MLQCCNTLTLWATGPGGRLISVVTDLVVRFTLQWNYVINTHENIRTHVIIMKVLRSPSPQIEIVFHSSFQIWTRNVERKIIYWFSQRFFFLLVVFVVFVVVVSGIPSTFFSCFVFSVVAYCYIIVAIIEATRLCMNLCVN